ncbi:MAG: DnaJ C-terminal domain-containing protein [Robiginitomaculum sp.]
MAKDPYKLLGVKKNATDKEISQAYRKLAKKWHPDVNQGDNVAAEKFKEISAAHTLLSDKKLRAQYDNGGINAPGNQQNQFAGGFGGAQRGAQMGGHEMGDILSQLFGMQMGGQRTGHPFTRPPVRMQKGADIRFNLSIGLPESIKGGPKHVRMSDGKTLKLTIPAGVKDKTTLRLRGKGGVGANGGPNGDAKVSIKVLKHKYLRRDGNKLRLDLPITLKEAVLGAKINVPTPHGAVSMKIAPNSSSGKILRLKGKGIKGGDLLVRLMIKLPEKAAKDFKSYVKSWPDTPDPRTRIKL